MWFRWIYNLLLVILSLLLLPSSLYSYFVKKKYQHSLFYKLGLGMPNIVNGSRPLIWIHAVSVGETRSIIDLAKKIKTERPEASLLISNGTETAHHEAKQSLPFADYFIYFPLDFSWIMKKILKLARPKIVIISETDLWWNFLHEAKSVGAEIFVVNAKISVQSQKRLQWFPFYSHRLLNCIDFWMVQSADYYQRFKKLGVPPNKMAVVGNLKFDSPLEKMELSKKAELKQMLGIQPTDFVITLGSTHTNEEEWILKEIWTLKSKNPQIKILVVPRHPDRFKSVFQHLKRLFIQVDLFSQLSPQRPATHSIIVLDTMGWLQKCYEISSLAIVCGSYVKNIGGHNLLEPSAFGVPVIFGPYTHAQPELTRLASSSQAGKKVELRDLARVIYALIHQPHARERIGEQGLKLIKSQRGVTDRCWHYILRELENRDKECFQDGITI